MQAVVDKSAVVASAVLVSAMHLLGSNAEIVRRWTNEIQEAIQSKHAMVQFHAVALLHALRANDRLAVSKLVSSLTRGAVRSPLAQCLLVRCALGGPCRVGMHAAKPLSCPIEQKVGCRCCCHGHQLVRGCTHACSIARSWTCALHACMQLWSCGAYHNSWQPCTARPGRVRGRAARRACAGMWRR